MRARRSVVLVLMSTVVAANTIATAAASGALTQISPDRLRRGDGDAQVFMKVDASPRQWDVRVIPFVRFVEHDRGLTFKHPVPVRFLGTQAFQAELTTKPTSLSRSDRAHLDEVAQVLRALGLAETDGASLFNQENTLNSANTEAFYDSDRKAVFIRGTSLDLAGQVTVVHELTHALQDQYFNLSRLNERASRAGNQASDAATSIIEGDAVTIENDYVSSLKQGQQNQYYANQNQQAAAAEGAVSSSVPGILQALALTPYDLGPTFVEALLKHGGHERLNRAFVQPPTTDAQIVNPSVYLFATRAPQIGAPALKTGETATGSPDSLGALLIYFTLAARLDPLTAVKAAEAVGADRFIRYQRAGKSCVRVALTTRSATSASAIQDALQRWVTTGPSGSATVDRTPRVVNLESCEPGVDALPSGSRMTDAETQLGNRAALLSQAIDGGLSVSTAQCAADRLFADPALAPILAATNPTQTQLDQLSSFEQRATSACSS